MDDKLLGVDELREIISGPSGQPLSRAAAYGLMRTLPDGVLIRIGRRVRVSRSGLARYLAQGGAGLPDGGSGVSA